MKRLLSSLIISAAAVSALLVFEAGRPGLASPNSPLKAAQRNAPPLTRPLLEQWLALTPPARDDFIASYVARNGIAFQPSAELLARLRRMNYSQTIRALEATRRPAPTPKPNNTGRENRTKGGTKRPEEPRTDTAADPNTITILVADFSGPDQQNYLVTEKILQGLRAATSGYSDISVQPLGETITEQTGGKGGSAYARDIGAKRKAGIVLWGYYGATSEQVDVSAYFEVLQPPKYLSLRQNFETKTLPVADLKGFKIQTPLSKEMSYLVLLTVGIARLESRDYEGAISRFTKALALSNAPAQIIDPADIYFYRGAAYYFKADANGIDHAIADLSEVIKLNPNYAEAYSNRGAAYYEKGQHDLAIADLNEAIRLQPDYAEAYYNRGTAYSEKGQHDLAIADYGRAIELKPNVEAYVNRGVAHYDAGQYDLAIADYGRALKLKPDFAVAYSNRGTAYIKKGQDDLALNDYNKAIQLKPDHANSYYNRGTAYAGKGRYDLAIADFDKTIQLAPDYAGAFYNRGTIYLRKGQYDLAIADYSRATEIEPDYAGAYFNRAVAYRNKGQFDRAIADLKSVLRITNDSEIRRLAEQTLQELGVR